MEIAVWIIAVVEIIRALQNVVPIVLQIRDIKNRDNAYAEFVKSLKQTDGAFVRRILEEYEKEESKNDNPESNRTAPD